MDGNRRPLHRIGAYRELAAPPKLARIVDVAWVHRAPETPAAAYPGCLVVPEPAVSLCFACLRTADGRVGDPEILVIGPVTVSRSYLPEPGRSMSAVRIHPEWCRWILGLDPRDHVDGIDDFGAASPADALPLLDRLRASGSPREELRCLFEFVHERATRTLPDGMSLLVHRGLQSLRRRPRPDDIRAIARSLSISTRHLRRLVSDTCGLPPRDYACLERFRGILRDADGTDTPTWRDLAMLHGYADQPHLTREIRRLSGMPPGRLHAERRRFVPAAGDVRIVQDAAGRVD